MGPNITAIRLKLHGLQHRRDAESDEKNWLMDAVPTVNEWRRATDTYVGARGRTNPEILEIDHALTSFHSPIAPKGARAEALKRIRKVVKAWRLRRDVGSIDSNRRDAMDIIYEIAYILKKTVVYDEETFIKRERAYPAAGPNIVPGGFGENGALAQAVRIKLIISLLRLNPNVNPVFDTMNEAHIDFLQHYGLEPGPRFRGTNCCHSGASVAKEAEFKVPVTLLDGNVYVINRIKPAQNVSGSHRFGFNADDRIIVDPTWRQFFPNIPGLPAVFVGPRMHAARLVSAVGGVAAESRVYNEMYDDNEKYQTAGE